MDLLNHQKSKHMRCFRIVLYIMLCFLLICSMVMAAVGSEMEPMQITINLASKTYINFDINTVLNAESRIDNNEHFKKYIAVVMLLLFVCVPFVWVLNTNEENKRPRLGNPVGSHVKLIA